MRILLVYHSEYPWDVRIQKMMEWLDGHGHEVHLLCANQCGRDETERIGGVAIHRLRKLPGWLRLAQEAANLPSHLNPRWYLSVRRLFRQTRFDVVIVRDLHVALAVLAAGHFARVPVFVDLAENWPSLLQQWRRHEGLSVQNLLLRHPTLSAVIERLAVKRAYAVFVVAEEMRDRLVSELAVDRARIGVVMNTPYLSSLPCAVAEKNGLLLVYSGDIHVARGLDTALHALAMARCRVPGIRLRVVGRGKPQQEHGLRSLSQELGIENSVEFTGWRPYADSLRLASSAHVGLCPLPACSHHHTTVANKVFEYMGMGLPVLCSDVRPQRRIVEETGAGLLFAAGSAESLAETMIQFTDSSLRAVCGAAGLRAVRQRYNWEVDAAVMEHALLKACRATVGNQENRAGELGSG